MRRGFAFLLAAAAMAFGAVAWGFDAYFADAQGNKITQIQEGRVFYVVVDDRELSACPPGEFTADFVIFDFKTGAYIEQEDARFLEIPNESGIYFWVDAGGNKIWVEVGDRKSWTNINEMEHWVGSSFIGNIWRDGNWMYVDEDVADPDGDGIYDIDRLPQDREVDRIRFAEFLGRFENMDTLVLILAATHDPRLIDQDQLKIVDTVSSISVSPSILEYGCGVACNIQVTINDPDENLSSEEVDYVPFFVIVNPGSWNCGIRGVVPPPGPPSPPPGPPSPPPGPPSPPPGPPAPPSAEVSPSQNQEPPPPPGETTLPCPTTFCALKATGGVDRNGNLVAQPIRWYNIYDAPRFIDYPDDWLAPGNTVAPVVFFAAETGPDTGVFVYNFGLLEDLQAALGFDRFDSGTTIAFYYLDPNDFDDFSLTTAQVYERPRSETEITDHRGNAVQEVKLGAHTGIYVRVYDDDANLNSCCQDQVVVQLCDPHGEDDSEYIIVDEVANDAGIFATKAAIPLEPVWDAIGGYQLVYDDWKFQAFNEDTIYARYNSVDYMEEDLNALGDGNANDGHFPPRIDPEASRNQVWDVSFYTVKVYDTQVFDGTTHNMRFLNGRYQAIEEARLGDNLYLEVVDPDQNENPLMAELIAGDWNKDADDNPTEVDSQPIWWFATGDSDRMTPEGALANVFLGSLDGDGDGNVDESITGLMETVKIFMWNAQRGTWERMDLKETAPDSGVFRSTTCVLVTDDRHPGDGNLGSRPEDTIFAFYQDPSNHSDISIISIKVTAGGPPAPVVERLEVSFDKDQYLAGETVTITVLDTDFAGEGEISGTNVLVLKIDDTVLETWDAIPAVPGDPDYDFRVTYTLPEDVSGTLTATYTQPFPGGETVSDTAQVIPAVAENVTGIEVTPNPFSNRVTFRIIAEPAGSRADEITVTIYDLLGRKVAEVSGTDTASVSWNGTDFDGAELRNGAYIWVAVVKAGDKVWVFRGFVYIKR